MTDLFAHESVFRLVLMFGMFGMILFGANAASTLQAERIKEANRKKRKTKKKKTAGRAKPGQRRGQNTLMGESTPLRVKKHARKAKAEKTRPLSEFERNTLDRYFVGRDYPKGSAGAWIVPV